MQIALVGRHSGYRVLRLDRDTLQMGWVKHGKGVKCSRAGIVGVRVPYTELGCAVCSCPGTAGATTD